MPEATAGFGAADSVTDRSASPTIVPADAVLLKGFGSAWSADTLAVDVTIVSLICGGAVVTMITVAEAPGASSPRAHATWLETCVQAPWAVESELKVTRGSR